MRLRVNTDLVAGLLGLFAVAVFWSGRGRLTHLSSVFPDTVLAIIAVLSLLLLGKAFMQPDVRALFAEGSRMRMVVVTAALFVWWWLIGALGFYIASVLVFLFLAWYLAIVHRQVRLPELGLWLAVIVLEVGFFYGIFTQVLHIRPPRGLFF